MCELLQVQVDRDVGVKNREPFGETSVIGVLHDRTFVGLGFGDRLNASDDRLDVAIGGDQFCGAFEANLGDAGDIVAGVAGKRLGVGNEPRWHAEFLHHLVRADPPIVHGVVQTHHGGHQLHQVFVARDDDDFVSCLLTLACQCGNDIVGLIALLDEDGYVHGGHELADEAKLRHQVFGGRFAVGFVFAVNFVSEGLLRPVEGNAKVLWILLAHELADHPGKTRDGICWHALAGGQWSDCVESAEDVAAAVHKINHALVRHGAPLLSVMVVHCCQSCCATLALGRGPDPLLQLDR